MSCPLQSVNVEGMRLVHFKQLLSYIDLAEDEGTYYGQKRYYDKRHIELKEWVEMIIRLKESE